MAFEAIRRLLPTERTRDVLTRVSQSLIDTYKTCPFLFYAEYVAPHPSGGTGLRSLIDDEAPWVGKVFGAGLEGWFRSGWRDRDYSEDAAYEALAAAAEAEREGAGFHDEWTKRTAAAQALLTSYLRTAGRLDPELFQVVELNGQPLIEVELEVPIADGLAYSSRPDLVALRLSDQKLCAVDHKTSGRPDTSRIEMRTRGQLTGEQWAVSEVFGVEAGCLVNLINKAAGKRKRDTVNSAPVRTLEKVDRTSARVELWRGHTIATLEELNADLEHYWRRCERMPEPLAARLTFDDTPTSGTCTRYNRPCRFVAQCERGEGVVEWHAAESRARYAEETGDAER